MILDLREMTIAKKHYYLQHVVGPRPICFASTIDLAGNVNLSPFSFFNLFSSQPPIVIFSPSRRVRNNTTKHTHENLLEIPEVVINIVTYDIVQQMSLASCEYPKGVNEFLKAGFTEEPATLVRPPMVKESKVKMECRVLEIKSLGDEGGAGNLVICEVLVVHIDDSIISPEGLLDQQDLELVARLGGDWYCKTDKHSMFKVPKPISELGIGIDSLPSSIRNSHHFSGNDLGLLANVKAIPDIDPSYDDKRMKEITYYFERSPDTMEKELQLHAKSLLHEGKVKEAWQVLLAAH